MVLLPNKHADAIWAGTRFRSTRSDQPIARARADCGLSAELVNRRLIPDLILFDWAPAARHPIFQPYSVIEPAGSPARRQNPDRYVADFSETGLRRLNRLSSRTRHSSSQSNARKTIDSMPVTSFGRVISVRGSLARVGLLATSQMAVSEVRATVGRFVSIRCANSTIVAMITEVSCENLPTSDVYIASASVDLLGEILGARGPPEIPARRHQLSDDRRYRRPDHQPGTAHGLCASRIGPDQCRHPAAGSVGHRLCRRRGNALQAFRGARLDRRRQIERRLVAVERDSQVAAEPAHLPARRPQRIWPLLRRPLAGAQSAQSEAAVLAVQFRGDRRRAVRRPARRAPRNSTSSPKSFRWRRASIPSTRTPTASG